MSAAVAGSSLSVLSKVITEADRDHVINTKRSSSGVSATVLPSLTQLSSQINNTNSRHTSLHTNQHLLMQVTNHPASTQEWCHLSSGHDLQTPCLLALTTSESLRVDILWTQILELNLTTRNSMRTAFRVKDNSACVTTISHRRKVGVVLEALNGIASRYPTVNRYHLANLTFIDVRRQVDPAFINVGRITLNQEQSKQKTTVNPKSVKASI
jgi:hypothetical protein